MSEPPVVVKTYKNMRAYTKDALLMVEQGYEPEEPIPDRGHINPVRTILKFGVVTVGAVGLTPVNPIATLKNGVVFGPWANFQPSRKGDRWVVTWKRSPGSV